MCPLPSAETEEFPQSYVTDISKRSNYMSSAADEDQLLEPTTLQLGPYQQQTA
jgi:hypothetical protein